MRSALIAVVVLFSVGVAVAIFTSRTSTPAFVDSQGNVILGSIAEERRVGLGGVEQYVLIRGRDRGAPLLVYVHGGPGASETPFLRAYNADLENDFVAVYWDQRGAGKSFDSSLDPATLNIARMTEDLGELVDLLLEEFEQDKVLLVAHSWGTILGLEHVAKRPETVAAYIAVSQMVNELESDAEGYAWAMSTAEASGDAGAVADLEALGPPPYSVDEFMKQRALLNALGGIFVEPQSNWQVVKTVLETPEAAWPDLISFFRGNVLSVHALWPEQERYDARQRHAKLDAPVFFMVGRHDHVISPRLSAEFLAAVEAPDKTILWFERSGHMLPFEEPERFNEEVRQIARGVGLMSTGPVPGR